MPPAIKNFAEAPNGLVYIADGVNPMQRWDGLAAVPDTAGVAAPTAAVTIAGGGGPGAIVGTYTAYIRFVDQYGYFSDLSPISNTLTPSGSTGLITAASNATPIVITSAAHGLATGNTVKVEGVGGNSDANDTWIITVVDANNFSLDGSSGNAAYTGGGDWTAGVSQINYTAVPVPVETKVVRRQLLRNLDGEAQTYYVDVDTTDLVSVAFNSTNTDSQLQAGTAVPILNPDGSPFANANGVPPNWKAALAFHLGRMFSGAEVPYFQGSVTVTNGSPTVLGIGTFWTAAMAGRFLYVSGANASYQVQSVNVATQTITLVTNYAFTTAPYANYLIRPAPAERRIIYYTEAGLPDSWPATNGLEIQENGDEITGLMVMSSFLYILERHHIHRFTFQVDPATDGYVFQASASRGCINQKCWIVVDDAAFMLDEQGAHVFEGGQVEPVSEPIQDIFRRGDGNYEINWSASANFHACHYPSQETIRWFVCLSGHYLPKHALAFNYRLKKWWIEQYPFPIGASTAMLLNGQTLVYLGATSNRVLALWTNLLDGPDSSAGTVQGTCTASTLLSLTDDASSFAASGLVGAPLTITDGTGKGQTRLIVGVSGQTLAIDNPWLVPPDLTSTYQIGGISYNFRSGWFRVQESENLVPARVEAEFEPVFKPATFTLRLTLDYFGNVVVWDQNYSEAQLSGVRIQQGSQDVVCDLEWSLGMISQRLDRHRDTYAAGTHWEFWDLLGTTNQDEVVFYGMTLDGVMQN